MLLTAFDPPGNVPDLVAGSRNASEFQRTLSRLVEMQSAAYLEAAHKPVAAPPKA